MEFKDRIAEELNDLTIEIKYLCTSKDRKPLLNGDLEVYICIQQEKPFRDYNHMNDGNSIVDEVPASRSCSS